MCIRDSCYVAPFDNGLEAHDGRRAIEKAMEKSGMDYAVIRSMVFMDNLTRFWSKPSITNNDIFAYPCSPDLKISWVCLNDVAKFMVAALSKSSVKANKIYIGGPEILLGDQVAERFSRALNREIKFKSLDPKNFAGSMSKLVTGSEEYEDVSIYGGMAAFYNWYNEQDPSPLAIDMAPAYKLLNVTPTYFEIKRWRKGDTSNIKLNIIRQLDNGDCIILAKPKRRIKVMDKLIFSAKDQVSADVIGFEDEHINCLLYTSPSPRDATLSRMPSSA